MPRRVKLSVAKKAVDSTVRRILNYTAEIILSIILLVIISIPLVFVIPMWFQVVILGTARDAVALDPMRWFGLDGALWFTFLLSFVSFFVGYLYILKLKPGSISEPKAEPVEEEMETATSEDDVEEIELDEEEEEEEEEEETIEEEVEEEEVEEDKE